MGRTGEQITVVLLAVVGVALLAVLVSKNANTSGVIAAVGQGFGKSLSAAISPIAGNSALNF